MRTIVPISLVGLIAMGFSAAASGASDMCAIEAAVVHYMQPGGVIKSGPPHVNRVAIEDNYSVALWTLGPAGGVAVLTDKSGTWKVLSNGGGWDSAEGLVLVGVPREQAVRLAKDFGMNTAMHPTAPRQKRRRH